MDGQWRRTPRASLSRPTVRAWPVPPTGHRGIVRLQLHSREPRGSIRRWYLVILLEEGAMEAISSAAAEELTRALGHAVVRLWSSLPQDVQHHLFEAAVTSHGESIRPQLAIFLHDKHPRTWGPFGKPGETT